jgi:hypothetical protein
MYILMHAGRMRPVKVDASLYNLMASLLRELSDEFMD